MAVKKKKAGRKKSPAKHVQLAKTQVAKPKKRKSSRKKGLAGKNDFVSKLLTAVIGNTKSSAVGFAGDLAGRKVAGAVGVSENTSNIINMVAGNVLDAVAPKKAKELKMIAQNTAVVSGAFVFRNLEDAFTAPKVEEYVEIATETTPTLEGDFARMSGDFSRMAGEGYANASATESYVVTEDQLEDMFN